MFLRQVLLLLCVRKAPEGLATPRMNGTSISSESVVVAVVVFFVVENRKLLQGREAFKLLRMAITIRLHSARFFSSVVPSKINGQAQPACRGQPSPRRSSKLGPRAQLQWYLQLKCTAEITRKSSPRKSRKEHDAGTLRTGTTYTQYVLF